MRLADNNSKKITLPSTRASQLAHRYGVSTWHSYNTRGRFLFKGIELEGKQVCDVGCGQGMWSVWCALQGAQVVGVEPEADGSSKDVFPFFKDSVEKFGLSDRVRCYNRLVEEVLPKSGETFDVLFLYDVINHLDEDAVQRLPHDEEAWAAFVDKFRMFRSVTKRGGWLILADQAPSNFWALLGLRSPFSPSIEWVKHQNPDVWTALANEAGFTLADVRWSYIYRYPWLTAYRSVQYFVSSHFVLRLRAV